MWSSVPALSSKSSSRSVGRISEGEGSVNDGCVDDGSVDDGSVIGAKDGAHGVPHKAAERLRLFCLNMAHGRREAANRPFVRRHTAQQTLQDIAATVRRVTPDVVALQEADGPSAWSGRFDHVATLAQLAELDDHFRGDHNPFGFGRFHLASGTALLSRQVLDQPISHRFGLSWRDTKGYVAATIRVPEWSGRAIDVASVHLDFLVPTVRRRQIAQMAERLAARRRPLVVLGDLNCCWSKEPRSMQMLTDSLGLRSYEPEAAAPTYPSWRPRRRLDWILVSDELEFCSHHTLPVSLSDHLVVVADLRLRDPADS